jgi:Family of unknown function (DUF6399)
MDLKKTTTGSKKKTRITMAEELQLFETKILQGMSQRKASKAVGVPRGTLLRWQERLANIPLPKSIIDFFESPDGLAFLDRLVNVLQFVMNQVGSCGIRLVSMVLRLSYLDYFVSSSYETLRERGVMMEEEIVSFGKNEQCRLSEGMPTKPISIVEDETYHHKPCLVAMEPVSNFILLEKYGDKRDAASWNAALDEALANLPIKVIQSTSDEARGIVNHVEFHLDAHHSPDIFHVQQDITKGTSAAMSAKIRAAKQTVDEFEHELKSRTENAPKSQRGRPSAISLKADDKLKRELTASKEKLNLLQSQQLTIQEAKKGIGAVYHPYDLNTGSARTTEQVEQDLLQHFATIEQNASAANLKDTALDKIKKAKRVCSGLVATMAFYWMMLSQMIESLSLSCKHEQLLRDTLIPAHYLMIASRKAKTAVLRHQIQKQAEHLLSKLVINEIWVNTEQKDQSLLMKAAQEYAQLFQRSSSCLEGRNGYLSLRHHGLHHLGDRKLETLTVIHNYFTTRSDHTTAAERFFNKKPRDLFEHLTKVLPSLPKPALQVAAMRRAA